MVGKVVTAVVALVFLLVTLLALMPDIVQQSEGDRTDPNTDSGLACTTGSSDTSCSITLTQEHEYSDTSEMTVTETSPGSSDRTSDSSLDADDRVSLTIASLATSTSYTFDVDYRVQAANVGDALNDLLRIVPLLLPLGLIAVVLLGVAANFGSFRF